MYELTKSSIFIYRAVKGMISLSSNRLLTMLLSPDIDILRHMGLLRSGEKENIVQGLFGMKNL